MTDSGPPNGLNMILYFLNYVTDLEANPILPPNLVRQIKQSYKPETVRLMCNAVKWSMLHPDFNFAGQLPVNYKNNDILQYLNRVNNLFEREGIYNLYASQ